MPLSLEPGLAILKGWPRSLTSRTSFFFLLLSALVVHGLLLLNDGVYWDGWLPYDSLMKKRWDLMYLWFSQAGLPTWAYVY